MKRYFSQKSYIFTVAVLALIVLGGLFLSTRKDVYASDESKDRLVTVYDRDQQKSLVTRAGTINEALEEAGIELDNNDIVEPARDSALIASSYKVNIYRARPVVVIDGNKRQKIMTPFQTARQIAESAGIVLYPEDITNLSLTNNMISDGAGLEMSIKRATLIDVNLYGKDLDLRTQGQTVGDFLEEKGINLESSDRVVPNSETAISEGMTIRIWREGKQTVSVEEPVGFEIEKIQDADRPIGYKAVRTEGVAGLKNVTYEIEIINGQEVSRKEIASVILEPAKKQVEVVGSKLPGVPYTGSGQKSDWLRAAGIKESDWGYVDFIIQKESNWNPNSVNKSSGACGLAQALPCSKVPGNPLDPVDNLKWANSYAQTCVSYRMYCGWEGAYRFWITNKWW